MRWDEREQQTYRLDLGIDTLQQQQQLLLLLLLYGCWLPCHEQSQQGPSSLLWVLVGRCLCCLQSTGPQYLGVFGYMQTCPPRPQSHCPPRESNICAVCAQTLVPGAFKFETKLEVLKLGWCKVGGNEGSRAMADLLMYNKTLRQVRGRPTA
jgi:hypothetical protein